MKTKLSMNGCIMPGASAAAILFHKRDFLYQFRYRMPCDRSQMKPGIRTHIRVVIGQTQNIYLPRNCLGIDHGLTPMVCINRFSETVGQTATSTVPLQYVILYTRVERWRLSTAF